MTLRSKLELSYLSRQLKSMQPKHVEMLNFYNLLYVCNVYDHLEKKTLISETIQGGIAKNKYRAAAKAYVEYVERKVVLGANLPSSHGAAAYPSWYGRASALHHARQNAYCEAIERHIYYTWAEDRSVGHHHCNLSSSYSKKILSRLSSLVPNWGFHIIEPFHSEKYNVRVAAMVLDQGVLCATAAGDNLAEVEFRALGELLRNVLAYRYYLKFKPKLSERSECSLIQLALQGHGLKRRFQETGHASVEKPHIKYDRELQHNLSKQIVVYKVTLSDRVYGRHQLI